MPPIFHPVPSSTVKEVLEHNGWNVVDEDQYNWLFEHGTDTLTVPKNLEGSGFVSLTIMSKIYEKTGLTSSDFYGVEIPFKGKDLTL